MSMFNTWRMCQTMCHEAGERCWYPLQRIRAIKRRSHRRKIVYSQEMIGQILDLKWPKG